MDMQKNKLTIEEYRNGIISKLDEYLRIEEVEASQRVGANPDYFQAVLTTVSKLRAYLKGIK